MKNDESAADASLSAMEGSCVLVVDDEPVTRLLLGRLFARVGLECVVVASSAEALIELGRRRFDLLLTDKNLGPTDSGVDLAAAARKLDPAIGVVLMTGYASADSADALFKLGVDDYVTKPFELPALLERLARVRELRRNAVRPPAVRRRHVLVGKHDSAFYREVGVALAALDCELHSPASLVEGLRGAPVPDAVVAWPGQLDASVRRELFLLRQKQPSLRVAVVGESHSLEDTLAAIGVAAHQRISQKLDPPALLETLAALLR